MSAKFIAITLVLGLLASCSDRDKILGEWVQPVPGVDAVQGFRLERDGKASSVNMATLLYEHWERNGNLLLLKGRSIGNHQTLDFVDTLQIEELTSDRMTLTLRGLRSEYRKND